MHSLPSTLKNQESEVMDVFRVWPSPGEAGGGRVWAQAGLPQDSGDGTGGQWRQESLGRLHGSKREMGPSFVL